MENFNENNSSMGSKLGGCLLKIVGAIIFIIFMAMAKQCGRTIGRQSVQNSYSSSYTPSTSETSKSDIDEQIYRVMDEFRKDLPTKIDERTTGKDVEMDDNYFYYIYDVEDSDVDWANMDIDQWTKLMKEELAKNLPSMRKLTQKLVNTNRGIAYKYHGTSSQTDHQVTFSATELKEILNNN